VRIHREIAGKLSAHSAGVLIERLRGGRPCGRARCNGVRDAGSRLVMAIRWTSGGVRGSLGVPKCTSSRAACAGFEAKCSAAERRRGSDRVGSCAPRSTRRRWEGAALLTPTRSADASRTGVLVQLGRRARGDENRNWTCLAPDRDSVRRCGGPTPARSGSLQRLARAARDGADLPWGRVRACAETC
jgi:hypothetical protein